MADSSVPITAGTGTNIDTQTQAGGDHRQVIVLGDAVAANVAKVNTGGDTLATLTSPNAAALSIFAYMNPYGTQRVTVEPTPLFFDPFDGAVIDVTNRWATAGTQVPTQASGQVTLAPTVGASVANNSTLISQPTFISPGLGFLIFANTITLEAAQTNVVNTNRFWGKGQVTSFAYTTPVTDGVGFEVEGTVGALQCVVYIGGTKYVVNGTNSALVSSSVAGAGGSGTAFPSGATGTNYGSLLTWKGGQHRYAIFVRSDVIYWFVEGTEVPVAALSYGVPNVQALPIRIHAITNNAATSLANTFTVGAVAVADTTAQNNTLSDGTYMWRRAKVGSAGDQAVSITTPATATNPTPASASIFSPSQELRIAMEGTQIFFDAFDSGLDTINKWKSPVIGGTGVAATSVAGSGGTTLSSGTTSNSFSLLESYATYQATDPGWLYMRANLNIEFAVLTTGYRFWGRGQTPAAPTIATPLNEAVGFEITTAGKLFAVMYAGGARTFAQDLSSSGSNVQPGNASSHDYMVWFKGNYMYWAIDSPDNIVATQTSGVNGPNYNNLPVKFLCVSNSGTTVTLAINSVLLGDTGRNNHALTSAAYPWRSAAIERNGSLRMSSGFPVIVQKKSGVSTGSVASLAVTFDAMNANGASIVVACGVGNGTIPTITDTMGNTYISVKTLANGTALNVALFVASNVVSGARNVVTVNNGGTTASIAAEIYEIDGFISVNSAVADVSGGGTGTSTSPNSSLLSPTSPNELVLFVVGVGTASQTITPTPNQGWNNDSGLLSPVTPAGLFSFASMSWFAGSLGSITPSATLGLAEPWAAVALAFRSAQVSIQGAVRISDGINQAPVKGQSAPAVASDPALTVTLSPNLPVPTSFLLNSAATTNATSIKGSAGTVFSIVCSNQTAAAKFVKFFNKATAPTVGTDLAVLTVSVPAASATVSNTVTLNLGLLGVRFSTGIGMSITNLVADTDTTVVALGDVKVIVEYL